MTDEKPQALKLGMLSVIPNAVLEQQEQDKARKDAESRQSSPEITALSAHVRAFFQSAKDAKRPIEKRMLDCLRARKGEYPPTKLLDIKAHGGSTIFMKLTDEKCSAAESWLADILMQPDEHPWGIKPTPVPDLPPELSEEIALRVRSEVMGHLKNEVAQHQQETGQAVTQGQVEERLEELQPKIKERFKTLYDEIHQEELKEAKLRAKRTETKLADIVVESNFEDALAEVITDICTFPNGFLMGPIVEKKKELAWNKDENGASVPKSVEKLVLTFRRISPLDVYPAPSSVNPEDGDIGIRHKMTRKGLRALIGVPHYNEQAIRAVLENHSSGFQNWIGFDNQTERDQLEDRGSVISDPSGKIDVLQYLGSIQGRMLIMNGVSADRIPEPLAEYDAEVWMCGNHVIKAVLNGDPLGRKRIYTASFRKVPGSFWGQGIPELIDDIQEAANAAARNLVNNMGIASGPQVGVDTSTIPAGEDIEDVYPWKVWQFDMANAQSTRPPMWFFQPNSMTAELLKVYEFFSSEADNKTGIPKYSYGTGKTQGAAGTSSGLSMLMSAAARGIKAVVRNIDRGIIGQSIETLFQWVMIYQPDPALQGDCKIVARGSSALIAKEQQAVRRNEAMQIIASSPAVLEIIGPEGLAEFLRTYFTGLDCGADEVVPRAEEIAARNNKDAIIQELTGQIQQFQQALEQGQPQQPQGLPVGREINGAGSVTGGMEANLFPRG
ncbi:MAG: hypothetical protein BA863_07825 [Desulfovibrio sp. S3730MH75]|nr:MAG: hypothetical protein BA863_07825 [Desulfovibrio sp. S3730MH75]